MTTHSELGASGFKRILECPGSVRLCLGIVSTHSTYADEGTAAHTLAELCLTNRLNAIHFQGDEVPLIDDDAEEPRGFVRVTDEMVDAVQVYLDAVRACLGAAGPHAFLLVEYKFDLSHLGRPDMFGTADACVCVPFGRLTVFDLKYGAGVPVEIQSNPQFLYYAEGACGENVYGEVETVVVQPRCEHPDGPVRRQLIQVEALHAWAHDVLIPGAEATAAPDAPLQAGDHCRFCDARPTCPELRRMTLVVAKDAFAPFHDLPIPANLKPADLCEILEKADLIEKWFGSIREYVHDGLKAGTLKPEEVGHKLIRGRAARAWKEEGLAKAWLRDEIGDAAYTPQKLISPAQAEKILPKHPFLAGLIRETRGVQMVSIDDPRPAIQDATIEFDEFKEEEA